MTAKARTKKSDALLIASLAAGGSIRAAAKRCGLSEATAYRRLDDPAFLARLDAAKDQVVSEATCGLSRLAVAAVLALGELLRSPTESVRLGAARSVLEFGSRYREADGLRRRLDVLERELASPETINDLEDDHE